MNLEDLQKYDRSEIYKIYDKWPDIARQAYESNLEPVYFKDINHIVFAGMGGSGTIGDLFSSILSKTNIHVNVTKGYLLPNTVDSNTVVVTTSISGNTIETLTVLDSANKLGAKTIGFSSGGKMQEYCLKNNINHRKIPIYHSPRVSFPVFLYSILKTFESELQIEKNIILESITQLEKTSIAISHTNLCEDNPSLNLAEWINEIPLIYYPYGLHAAAIRFKNSLQENAKLHVMAEDVIETCHNGIVSWEKNSSVVQPILIEGHDDYIKTKERWSILKKYFEDNGIEYRNVESIKGNIISKLTNLIYMLDYTSIYKAVLDGIDPSPVRSIDFIKSKIS